VQIDFSAKLAALVQSKLVALEWADTRVSNMAKRPEPMLNRDIFDYSFILFAPAFRQSPA
jgi:hypothetical protein